MAYRLHFDPIHSRSYKSDNYHINPEYKDSLEHLIRSYSYANRLFIEKIDEVGALSPDYFDFDFEKRNHR